MKTLEAGEYVLPDNMTIERTGKFITIRQIKNRTPSDKLCRYCKYFGSGQATHNGYTTTVCKLQPKKLKHYDAELYYHIGERTSACEKFERKEDNQGDRCRL